MGAHAQPMGGGQQTTRAFGARDSSKVRELTRDFHQKLKGEIDTLKMEIRKLKHAAPPRWHLGFFANYWASLDEWQAGLFKAIDKLQTVHTSYDPIELRREPRQ